MLCDLMSDDIDSLLPCGLLSSEASEICHVYSTLSSCAVVESV
jgi:hypothetical protein